jgi:uncharacterized membrane protein
MALSGPREFSYIEKVNGTLLWLNLFYLMALCLVPFASGMLSEHGGLRAPFLVMTNLRPGIRQDMILSPLLIGAVFLLSAGLAVGERMRAAHWMLLMIVPVASFFGSRNRRPA